MNGIMNIAFYQTYLTGVPVHIRDRQRLFFFVIILIVAYEHSSLLCEESEYFNSNTLLILNVVSSHFTWCDKFCYYKVFAE
jgi:hypothetical protein